jgi:Acyl-CoA reductase (LuxC)
MTLINRIEAFSKLGDFLKQFSANGHQLENDPQNEKFYDDLIKLIGSVHFHNGWFTKENVQNAITEISSGLNKKELRKWLVAYDANLLENKTPKKVAVIMAGNIPLVGFHDMLSVLISGNNFVGKLSSDDNLLLPFIAKVLIDIEPEFAEHIEFVVGQLKNIDAVIATGSDNTSRYFEYYFGKYPNIIRKNRNSVAVLTGHESIKDLRLLGKDVFQYFGLGCRNVSKLFVPMGYKFDTFYESVFEYQYVVNNNKYGNNYDYNRTVYLMGVNPSLLDNNFLLLKEDESYSSPIGVLFFEYYDDLDVLAKRLDADKEKIQCIVSNDANIKNAIPFGNAQCPGLSDYADGVDTMKFLLGL